MKNGPPIVFVHFGPENCWYFPYVLYQAKKSNPNSEIILMSESGQFKGIRHVPISEYGNEWAEQFKRQYIHRSSNFFNFELSCYLRWFYILEFMKKEKIESLVHLDTDVLLYSCVTDILTRRLQEHWDCAFTIHADAEKPCVWEASAHLCCWSRSALYDFCYFMLSFEETQREYIKEKLEWHRSNGISGGISDMVCLYMFWNNKRDRVMNLLVQTPNGCIDGNINSSSNYFKNEFIIEHGIKKIRFINNMPYLIPSASPNRYVLAHALHFQGSSKIHIPDYYCGGFFPGLPAKKIRRYVKKCCRLLSLNHFP